MSRPVFQAIGLVATDMPATLAFYRELGLDIPAEADDQPHVDVPLPGGIQLMWDTTQLVRSLDPNWDGDTGGSTLAFNCGSPAEVDRVYAGLTAAGHRGYMEPFDADWGQRYAVVLDPDGNDIDLFATTSG
ncbi:MAG: VOC family protein [Stackebrandtia sp.]